MPRWLATSVASHPIGLHRTTTLPSSGAGGEGGEAGRVRARVSVCGRVVTLPDAVAEWLPGIGRAAVAAGEAAAVVGRAAAASASAPAGRESRAAGDSRARVRRSMVSRAAASAGRSSGSRAVAAATRSSSAGSRPGTRLEGNGIPPWTCW
jgi:hypothetical protein